MTQLYTTTNPVVTIIDGQGNPQTIIVTQTVIAHIKNDLGVSEEYILTQDPEVEVTSTEIPTTVPVVSTSTGVTSITTSGATSGGAVISGGGGAILRKGVCWSTGATPTISDSKTNNGTGTASFISILTGLIDDTHYYVRAYAENSLGAGYGDIIEFDTEAIPLPLQEFMGFYVKNSACPPVDNNYDSFYIGVDDTTKTI
jgi:hypothetical protein